MITVSWARNCGLSRGRILYHLYKNVNLVEICCEIASDVLSAYDVFPFLQ